MADGHRDVVRRERWTRTRRCLSTPEVVRSSRRCLRIRLERARRARALGAGRRRGAAPPKQSIVLTKDDRRIRSNLPRLRRGDQHGRGLITIDDGGGERWEILCLTAQRRITDSILDPGPGASTRRKTVTVMITDRVRAIIREIPSLNKRWCRREAGITLGFIARRCWTPIMIEDRGVVDVRYRRTSCDSMGEERYYE